LLLIPQSQQKNPYYNKAKKPSSWGITAYIKNNEASLIAEYEYLVDTLYDVYIFAEDISKSSDVKSLGEFYIPDQIVITTEEEYIEYELKNLTKYQQRVFPYTLRTVKAVVFHELTHAYFYQISYLTRQEGKTVSPEYGNIRLFPNAASRFGSSFIEEGVCEYVVYMLNESTPMIEIEIPTKVEDLMNKDKEVNILYSYSVFFLRDFLDEHGLKEGIRILIQNKPPTYEEILNPKLFFNRINKY
jgi:hypothetical protein